MSTKRILTLTTQYANNMGAMLQCYALCKFLNNQDNIECEVIQYFPKGHERSWKILRSPRTFRDAILTLYSIIRVDRIWSFNKKKAKMRRFITNNIPLTNEKYKVGELQSKPPHADAIIVGSDQVWNFRLRKDLSFFLDFLDTQPNCKRIAYAPSIADPWDAKDEEEVRPLLKKFDALSIREALNLPQVQRLSPDNNPTVVLDPVFLLGQDEWNKVLTIPDVKSSYILCYFLSASSLAVRTVEKVKKMTNLSVVYLNVNKRDKLNSDVEITDADPCDFIGLVAQASYIVTNSFHCSAFSIIFRKNFVFIPKGNGNSRIEGLRETFKTSDFFMNEDKLANMKLEDLIVDYSFTDEASINAINYSKSFLLDAVE